MKLALAARARAAVAQIQLSHARIRPELADEFLDDIDATFASLRERNRFRRFTAAFVALCADDSRTRCTFESSRTMCEFW